MQLPTKFISSITLAATLASASVFPRQAEPGNYTLTFTNQTGAVQGTDFITFGLFETTDGQHLSFCPSSFAYTCLGQNARLSVTPSLPVALRIVRPTQLRHLSLS